MESFGYLAAAVLSFILYVMFFVWMSRISSASTALAAMLKEEQGMRAAMASDLSVIKRHFEAIDQTAKKAAAEAKRAATAVEGEEAPPDPYDARRIPKDRWYQYAGNVGDRLVNIGLITKQQLNAGRSEFQTRGGHLCDHLIALDFFTDAQLKAALGQG